MHSTDDYHLSDDSQLEQASTGSSDKYKNATKSLGRLLTRNPKVVVPLVLIFLTSIGVFYFLTNKPDTPIRRSNLTPPLTVSVREIIAQEFQVNVQSYGNISPRTQSFLVAQVSGVVTHVGYKSCKSWTPTHLLHLTTKAGHPLIYCTQLNKMRT